MRVLDLFSGTGSATAGFEERGDQVRRLDITDAGGRVDILADIREFAPEPYAELGDFRPDHIHASPPCEGFAVPSIGRMWEKDGGGPGIHTPKHRTSRLGLELLEATVRTIRTLKPKTWVIENPRAMMRKVVASAYPDLPEPKTAMYCRYGPLGPVEVFEGPDMVWAQKATDFWFSGFDWEPKMCPDRPPKAEECVGPFGMTFVRSSVDGKPCHERAKRGSKCGVQRIRGSSLRAMLPIGLSREIAGAVG